ncbi:MAG TPA: CRTAC1 family protein [Bryobacteraceae bacterium]|nr:CRTAC1 family protein [Bryobacteraceae bacterium]
MATLPLTRRTCTFRHVARLLAAVACLAAVVAAVRAVPAEDTAQRAGNIRFEQPAAAGIDFKLDNATTADKPIIDSVLGGVAVLDYDGDGWLDVYFTNGAAIPSLVKTDRRFWNRLYRNNGDGTFTDVTERAGVAGEGYSMGVAVGDYDNDGYPDLFVAGLNHDTLYHNLGNGSFRDVTAQAHLQAVSGGKKPWSVGAAWLDFDNDGKLDLFVSNYLDWSPEKAPLCGQPGRRLSCSPALYGGLPNALYRNNGDGTFTDVSSSTGILAHIGKGMGVAVADYDSDGWPDMFVANDNERNFLFHNLKGRRFEEIGVEAGVAYTEDGVPASTMGVDFRDLDDDGRPDLVFTALAEETFSIRMNRGRGVFEDATYESGVGLASALLAGWSVGAYDFDNDGDKDLFTTNSHVSENVRLYSNHEYKQPNAIFENVGAGRFVDASKSTGKPTQVPRAHRGAAFGDFNNDGRMDVVASAIGDRAVVLMNACPRDRHWFLLRLKGTTSNRDGMGARIKLTSASGRVQYNHATTSVGYVSSSDPRVHFGLGNDASARDIEIAWPSGKVQHLTNARADRILNVVEP